MRKRLFLISLLPITIMLTTICSKYPDFVESIYSNHIYTTISILINRFTGLFNISLAEIIIIIFIPILIVLIICIIFLNIKQKNKWHIVLIGLLLNFFSFFGILYFSFNIVWGLNYYRNPLSKTLNLEIRPSSVYELENLCADLISRANNIRSKADFDSYNYLDVFLKSRIGYDIISKKIPELSGSYSLPKGVICSEAMCYLGIAGFYFPFTAEANVNIKTPKYMMPCTTCHEMAHQIGFAREDEANYIAYLVCINHPDYDFQYSGLLLALIHSMKALSEYDIEKYLYLKDKYCENIKSDLSQINEFWKQYEGPIEKTSNKLNNAYLKSNRQSDGVQSYGRMVDLLIGEYTKKSLKTD